MSNFAENCLVLSQYHVVRRSQTVLGGVWTGSLYCVCSTWLNTARRGHRISTAQAKMNFVLCSTKSCREFLVAPRFEEWRGSVQIWGIRTATEWELLLFSAAVATTPLLKQLPYRSPEACRSRLYRTDTALWWLLLRQRRLRMLCILVFTQLVVFCTGNKAREMYKTHTGMFITPCSGSRCDSLFFLCVKTCSSAFQCLKQFFSWVLPTLLQFRKDYARWQRAEKWDPGWMSVRGAEEWCCIERRKLKGDLMDRKVFKYLTDSCPKQGSKLWIVKTDLPDLEVKTLE